MTPVTGVTTSVTDVINHSSCSAVKQCQRINLAVPEALSQFIQLAPVTPQSISAVARNALIKSIQLALVTLQSISAEAS